MNPSLFAAFITLLSCSSSALADGGTTLSPYAGASTETAERSLNFGASLDHEGSGSSLSLEWSRYFSDPSYLYLYVQGSAPTVELKKLGKARLTLTTGSLTGEIAEDYFSEELSVALNLSRPLGPFELSLSGGPMLTAVQRDPERAPLTPAAFLRVDGSFGFLKDLCELRLGLGTHLYPVDGRAVSEGNASAALDCDFPKQPGFLGENRLYAYTSVSQDFAIAGTSTDPNFGLDASAGLGFRVRISN